MREENVHFGGCHCRKVRYELRAPLDKVIACNCSICARHGLWLTFVPGTAFTLLSGDAFLKDYTFGRQKIHHLFCSECGVESFARGKSTEGVEMIAVNVRCLDDVDVSAISPTPFDGRSL